MISQHGIEVNIARREGYEAGYRDGKVVGRYMSRYDRFVMLWTRLWEVMLLRNFSAPKCDDLGNRFMAWWRRQL